MSVLNLVQSYEVNAKGPTVASAVDESFFNMKVGKYFDPLTGGYELGYSDHGFINAKGQLSKDPVVVGESLVVSHINVLEDDTVTVNLSDTQLTDVTEITFDLNGVECVLTWDASTEYTATVAGAYAALSSIVGGVIKVEITDTTV